MRDFLGFRSQITVVINQILDESNHPLRSFMFHDCSTVVVFFFFLSLEGRAAFGTKCLPPCAGNVTILPQEVKSNTFLMTGNVVPKDVRLPTAGK